MSKRRTTASIKQGPGQSGRPPQPRLRKKPPVRGRGRSSQSVQRAAARRKASGLPGQRLTGAATPHKVPGAKPPTAAESKTALAAVAKSKARNKGASVSIKQGPGRSGRPKRKATKPRARISRAPRGRR